MARIALLVIAATSAPTVVAQTALTAPTLQTPHAEFSVPAGMLDTWNAVGQVLVRMDDVIYEGRAQMLGLYAVQYRGERFLIVTKGRVLKDPTDNELTLVCAILQDGKPDASDPAFELLARLEQRLPGELQVIAAGEY